MASAKNRNPKFSIVTPTFRRPEMLVRCIASVLNQTFKDFEHIIVDDGNDLITNKIVDGFNDERLVLLVHKQPRGAAAAYNTGIGYSNGGFISFLDDDDEYYPDFLDKVYEKFSIIDNKADFVWTGINKITEYSSGEKVESKILWPSYFKSKESAMMAASVIGNGFGLCVRRDCFEKTGIYDENLKVCSDTDFMIRLAASFVFETIPIALVKIHKHESGQLTDNLRNQERINNWELIFERYKSIFKQFPEMYFCHTLSYAILCYSTNQIYKGRRALLAAIAIKPFRIKNYITLISLELTGKSFSNTAFGRLLIHRIL